MRRPSPGDEVIIDGRPARVTTVDDNNCTFCVVFTDRIDEFGNGDRAHDLPWPVLIGQTWACDYTEPDQAPLD